MIIFILLNGEVFANCPSLLKEAKKNDSSILLINFDGLGTAELGLKVLERRISKKIKKRCGKKVVFKSFHYGDSGSDQAVSCAESFNEYFGPQFSLNIFGHSYGGGKGVFNFLSLAKKTNLQIINAVTFDPRGDSYQYTNPGNSLVSNFINFFQRIPLAGMVVENADYEFDVTGKTSHISLPKDFSEQTLNLMVGDLTCAHSR